MTDKSKSGGWSMSGTLIQQGQQEVSLQCNFEGLPNRATNYTAQFKVTPKIPANSLGNTIVEAEVTWSVSGNSVRRVISVANGVSIQGTGEAVRVVIRDVSTVLSVPPVQYDVSVQVAPGTRSAVQNPPTLEGPLEAAIAAGGNRVVNVPQNAGITSVAVLPTSVTPIPLDDQDVIVQQISGAGIVSQYDPRQYLWIPMAPGVTTLNIFNGSADPINAKIIWGIDG